ncbi:MAG: hypothetical protein Q9166_000648 [cf. Caloplaca sp. 2 TL-2023]
MFQERLDLDDLEEKFHSFYTEVMDIITPKRLSDINPSERKEFHVKFKKYRNENENTVLPTLLPYLIRENRTVEVYQKPSELQAGKGTPPIEGNPQVKDEEKEEIRTFLESGIMTIQDREYQRTFLPYRNGITGFAKELLFALSKPKDPAMTNPKPDRLYAIDRERTEAHFPPTFQMSNEIRHYMEVIPTVHHPFLVLEAKSEGGSNAECRNQACRSGAAIVHCFRELRRLIGEEDGPGADIRTFMFSATLCDGQLEIYVHWAEVSKEKDVPVRYHMTFLAGKSINDKDENALKPARRILHNIMDWGCGKRWDEKLVPLHNHIVKYQKEETENEIAKAASNTKDLEVAEASNAVENAEVKKRKLVHVSAYN